MVARHGGHGAHSPLPHAHARPRLGQVADESVELEHGEAARGPAQVEGARNRLLARVAALRQVHGRAQPVQLVGDRAGIGLAGPAGAAGLNAQRLPGQGAGQAPPLPGGQEGAHHSIHALCGHQDEAGPVGLTGVRPVRPDVVARAAVDDARPRVPPQADE